MCSSFREGNTYSQISRTICAQCCGKETAVLARSYYLPLISRNLACNNRDNAIVCIVPRDCNYKAKCSLPIIAFFRVLRDSENSIRFNPAPISRARASAYTRTHTRARTRTLINSHACTPDDITKLSRRQCYRRRPCRVEHIDTRSDTLRMA